jgi:hypothetical protein
MPDSPPTTPRKSSEEQGSIEQSTLAPVVDNQLPITEPDDDLFSREWEKFEQLQLNHHTSSSSGQAPHFLPSLEDLSEQFEQLKKPLSQRKRFPTILDPTTGLPLSPIPKTTASFVRTEQSLPLTAFQKEFLCTLETLPDDSSVTPSQEISWIEALTRDTEVNIRLQASNLGIQQIDHPIGCNWERFRITFKQQLSKQPFQLKITQVVYDKLLLQGTLALYQVVLQALSHSQPAQGDTEKSVIHSTSFYQFLYLFYQIENITQNPEFLRINVGQFVLPFMREGTITVPGQNIRQIFETQTIQDIWNRVASQQHQQIIDFLHTQFKNRYQALVQPLQAIKHPILQNPRLQQTLIGYSQSSITAETLIKNIIRQAQKLGIPTSSFEDWQPVHEQLTKALEPLSSEHSIFSTEQHLNSLQALPEEIVWPNTRSKNFYLLLYLLHLIQTNTPQQMKPSQNIVNLICKYLRTVYPKVLKELSDECQIITQLSIEFPLRKSDENHTKLFLNIYNALQTTETKIRKIAEQQKQAEEERLRKELEKAFEPVVDELSTRIVHNPDKDETKEEENQEEVVAATEEKHAPPLRIRAVTHNMDTARQMIICELPFTLKDIVISCQPYKKNQDGSLFRVDPIKNGQLENEPEKTVCYEFKLTKGSTVTYYTQNYGDCETNDFVIQDDTKPETILATMKIIATGYSQINIQDFVKENPDPEKPCKRNRFTFWRSNQSILPSIILAWLAANMVDIQCVTDLGKITQYTDFELSDHQRNDIEAGIQQQLSLWGANLKKQKEISKKFQRLCQGSFAMQACEAG